MVSVWCLPSHALLQHLSSYLGFSYLRCGVSLHGCSSEARPLLLTLDEGYLLTAAVPDLQRGIAPLGPPAPVQPPLLGIPLALASGMGVSSPLPPLASGSGWLSGSPPLTSDVGCLLPAAPDLRRGVAPLGCRRTQFSVPIFTREQDYWLDCSLPLLTLLFLHQVTCVSSLTPLFSTQLCEFLCVPDGGEHLGN